jgi:hypothetical protein
LTRGRALSMLATSTTSEPAMSLRLPLGVSDFRTVRELGLEYVDKTDLICQLLDRPGAQVVLLPRPRRFGKTLNLSMLRCFFERREEDLSHLFEGLRVFQAGEAARAHFQRYPVIHLSFKDVKFDHFERCWDAIRKKIADLFMEHGYLLQGGRLSEVDARRYQEIVQGTASQALYDSALADLSRHLHVHHGEKVVILVDEYDEPIHAAYVGGYARQVLEFFRAFLAGGLKDNPHLERAVLTGILRIAKESIFSGLNNPAVYSLLRAELGTSFGFTQPEVLALLEKAGRRDRMDLVRHWYNGYDFGGHVIYNPWSVVHFVADPEGEPRPYWLSTSSNELIKRLLEQRATRLGATFEALVEGGGLERVLEENVVLDEIDYNDDALWSLLVFSGYLKAEKRPRGDLERSAHWLSIPNREVREVYTGTFRAWMQARMRGHGGDLQQLASALLGGDEERLQEQLQAFATNLLSYHDGGVYPEHLYHGFIVGLLAVLEPEYQVRSNRESGMGRPDVLIRPSRPGLPGVALELKVARAARKKTLEQALDEGLEQLRRNDYTAELRAAGASPVHAFVNACDGKHVRVRAAG